MSKIDKPSVLAVGCLVAMLCVPGEAKTNRKLVSQACNWGVFSLSPPRRLAIIPAQDIYIQSIGDWPILVTYIHGSASEGLISVYKYAGNHYVKTRGDFEVSAYRKDFPKSMEKPHSTCEQSNASRRKAR